MSTLQIHYTGRLANLYDVGYLSVDLGQLVAFTQALEAEDGVALTRWYGEKAHAFNRFAPILFKNADATRIIDARPGSIELVVEVIGSLVPVICTLLHVYLAHHLEGRDCEFTIDTDDQLARRAVDAYKSGAFGSGATAIERLSEHLAMHNRSMTALGDNAYLVDRVLDKYAKRIVRTIRRP